MSTTTVHHTGQVVLRGGMWLQSLPGPVCRPSGQRRPDNGWATFTVTSTEALVTCRACLARLNVSGAGR